MSDILESVETEEGVEIISGEDLLAKEDALNKKIEDRMSVTWCNGYEEMGW
jgi:hypothetical protein